MMSSMYDDEAKAGAALSFDFESDLVSEVSTDGRPPQRDVIRKYNVLPTLATGLRLNMTMLALQVPMPVLVKFPCLPSTSGEI